MIAHAPVRMRDYGSLDKADHEQFLQMLPTIRSVAHFAFRRWRGDRQELIAEVIANCFVMFCRLVERNKANLAYPSPLAHYAIKQIRDGRRIGNRLNIHDASSAYCQQRKYVRMRPLRRFDPAQGKWQELLIEDGHATPADVAMTRIDFADWLRQLPHGKRNVAKVLATGEGTQAAAKRFGVSKARISQIRSELQSDWEQFQGNELAAA